MDKENFSWGGIGFLALFFLLIIGFWNRGGVGFGYGNGYGTPYDGYGPAGYGFQNYRATVDAEKAEIINTAATQYKTIEQAQLTRDTVNATANATQAKIDFYAYQDLRDRLSEEQRKVLTLENQLFVKDQLAPLMASVADIRCNMLVRPNITGIGAVCPNAGVLNGLGINGLNGCGCNGLV